MGRYLSIREAAEKWGVSERRIHQYCSEGRIPGAERIGKAWVIPADADKPGDPRKQKKQSVSHKSPNAPELFPGFMPLLNTPFEPGHCIETIEKMKVGPKKDIAMAEYHYFSGQAEQAAQEVELYLADRDLEPDYPQSEAVKRADPRPDKVCLCYPVISFLKEPHEGSAQALTGGQDSLREKLSAENLVTPDYPPAFVWTCADDDCVPPSNAVRMGEALERSGVRHQLHIYPSGGHGCALAFSKEAWGWSQAMTEFFRDLSH